MIEVFYCYSRQDKRLRDQLEVHLSLLQRQQVIASWHDRRIEPGADWAGQIDAHLNSAGIILLLVSADFLATDYCYNVELTRALEREAAGQVRVIPVILRPCDWLTAPFGRLQGLPQNGKPIAEWASRDKAFLDVAQGIRRVAEELAARSQAVANPFFWRGGITSADCFFNRDAEQGTLRAYLRGRQNCQVVGPRRIGKTSLLRQVERVARGWEKTAVVAYLDMQDPRCHTLAGWLRLAARQWGWVDPAPSNLAEFAEQLDGMRSAGHFAVLCLDEFEELTARRGEFTRDFLLTLRSCAQGGMSIVTATQSPLSALTDAHDPTSPFYNTFPILRLGPFAEKDATDFVVVRRPGLPSFTPEEKAAILAFTKGLPLALQVACFHVVEAKQYGESLPVAMKKAEDDMQAHLRNC